MACHDIDCKVSEELIYIYIMIVDQNPSYMMGLHVVSLTCMVAPVGLAE